MIQRELSPAHERKAGPGRKRSWNPAFPYKLVIRGADFPLPLMTVANVPQLATKPWSGARTARDSHISVKTLSALKVIRAAMSDVLVGGSLPVGL